MTPASFSATTTLTNFQISLEELEKLPKSTKCLEPDLTELQKVQLFAEKSRENSAFASALTKEDFSQDPLTVRYQEKEGTIAPYELFLLVSQSEALFNSLNWSLTNDQPAIDLFLHESAAKHVISALQGEAFSLSTEEQADLLSEFAHLLFDQQALHRLLPICQEALEELSLEDLLGLSPPFFTIPLIDEALAKILKNISLTEEELQTHLSILQDVCKLYWRYSSSLPLVNAALCQLFTPLVNEGLRLKTFGQNEILQAIAPPISLEISQENILLLENSFAKTHLARILVKEGSRPFYRQVMELLKGCKTEAYRHLFAEDSDFFEYINPLFSENKALFLAAIEQDVDMFLQHASAEQRNDPEIVLTAIKQSWPAIKHASFRLKDNKELVFAAVNHNGLALKYASDELKNDPEIVSTACKKSPRALQYASLGCKNNKRVVLTAVRIDGMTLEFASLELQDDPEVVLAAIEQKGQALDFASRRLKHDRKLFELSEIMPYFFDIDTDFF